MRTRASIIIGATALAICLICPLLDMFDQWDNAVQTGNDSEYPLVILALCVGMAFALGRLILRISRNILTSSIRYALQVIFNPMSLLIHQSALAIPSISPPLSLRI